MTQVRNNYRKGLRTTGGLPTAAMFGLLGFAGLWVAFKNLSKAVELRRDLQVSDGVVTQTIAHKSVASTNDYYVTYVFLGRTKKEKVWRSIHDAAHATKQVTVFYSAANPDLVTIDRNSFWERAAISATLGLVFIGFSMSIVESRAQSSVASAGTVKKS